MSKLTVPLVERSMRRMRVSTWLAIAALLSCEPGEEASDISAAETVLPPASLSAPGTSTSGNVTVTWGASPTAGVDEYELQQSTTEVWATSYRGPSLRADLRFVAAQTVRFRVRACIRSKSACSGFTLPVTVVITPVFPDYLSSTCDPIPAAIPAQENAGAIAGEAGVSGGAATYEIPIAIAPGRRGIQPSLALSYSSRGGSEIAGVGFTLSGTSRIHRCPRTTEHDGIAANVGFTADDRLCLDGQRLVVVGGSYGASGSVYRTELDRFARVTMTGAINGTTTWFKVEEKSGAIHYYGAYGNTNAVESYGGLALHWWIKQSEDRQRNSILYTYAWQTGQLVLSGISYTGTNAAAGDRTIALEYEARPDKSTRYHAGRLMRSTRRLKAITSKVQTQVVRRYELTYSVSRATTRSLLSSVKECTASPCTTATSLPPTTFAYQDEPPAFEEQTIPGGEGEFIGITLGSDYDGDGARDWIRKEHDDPTDPNADGQANSAHLYLTGDLSAPHDIESSPCNSGDSGLAMTYGSFPGWGNTDFDQDGRADLLGVRADGAFVIRDFAGNVKASEIGLFTESGLLLHTGDFDGNGMSDLVIAEQGQPQILLQDPSPDPGMLRFNRVAAFPSIHIEEGIANLHDYDGNGLPDALVDWTDSAYPAPGGYVPQIAFTALSNGQVTFTLRRLDDIGGPALSIASSGGHRGWLDLNADGLLDLYDFRSDGTQTFWVNRGGTFQPASVSGFISIGQRHYDDLIAMDWDTDGVTELLVPSQIVMGWCYLYDTGGPEPIEYCSTNSSIDFETGGAPHWLDRSIYRYDAIELVDDGTGAFTVQRVPTSISAPLGSQADDYGGDGLADVKYRLKRLFRATSQGTVAAGDYTAPPEGQPGVPWTGYGNKIMRNIGAAPDLLTSVQNGLGARATWAHAPLSSSGVTGCDSQEIPFYVAHHEDAPDADHFFFTSSMHAVARFSQSNGAGGMNPTCYRYQDAMFHAKGRGFLGFKRIIEEQALGDGDDLRTSTTFLQRFPFISTPIETSMSLASDPLDAPPLEKTTQRWSSTCTGNSSGPPAEICFNFVEETIRTTRDLTARAWVSTTTTTMGYVGSDLTYGNPSWEEKALEDRTTRYSERSDYAYEYADASAWWIARLRQKIVTTRAAEYMQPPQVPAPIHPENGEKVVTTTYDYHPNGHATWARLPKLTRIAGQLADEWAQTELNTYDAYGNSTLQTETAAGMPRPRATSRTFTSDGYFLATETRPHAHQSIFGTDAETGQVTSAQLPNGNVSAKVLDAFGRTLQSSEPGLAPVQHRVLRCDASCPARARMRMWTQQDGAPIQVAFLDELGRAIESRRTAFDGSWIVEVTELDARGRTLRTSMPSTTPGGAFFTRFEDYDPLGRAARKIVDKTGYVDASGQPDTTFVTEYQHHGLTTRIVLDGALVASRTYNALGQLMQTVDTMGGATRYRYDGRGKLILIEDSAGNQTRIGFDDLGHRRSIQDPDRGDWSFTPNGIGELMAQTDANGDELAFVYDDLGRVTERRLNGARESTWTFDGIAKGTLDREQKYDPQGGILFTRTFAYDAVFREKRRTSSFNGKSYEIESAYDCQGKLWGIEAPNGEAMELDYTPYGFLKTEKNPLALAPSNLYREVTRMSAWDQVEEERFGNGLVGKYEMHAPTGQVSRLRVCRQNDPTCATPLSSLEYGYQDPFGNLTSQTKRFHGVLSVPYTSVREDYRYDDLQRLDLATRTWLGGSAPAPVTVDYAYDALGNLRTKNDYATSYVYGLQGRSNSANAGPHAIRSIDKIGQGTIADFTYDDNGNLIAGDGRQIAYTFHNQPATIIEGTTTTRFFYDPNHDRYRQESGGTITHYADKLYEEVGTEQKAYLGSTVVLRGAAGRQIRWLHTDRLGSIETISDESGAVKEVESFDAFGAPRDKTWQDNGRLLASTVTTRGFTTHEHLDEHGLIHMNGRAYDPGLARFLSVDPFVQDIANSQNLNPYSYVLNNPLAATDPTGYNGDFIYGASVATFWGEKEAKIIASVEGGCSMCGDASAGIEMVQAIKEGGKEVNQELSKGESIRVAAVSAILGRAALKALKKLAERKAHRKMVQGRKKDANAPKKSVKNNGSTAEPSSKKDTSPSDVGAPAAAKETPADTATGKVYKVPGEDTPSGKEYVGRTTHADGPPGRGKADGRNRENAEIVDTYTTTREGRTKEQRTIDENGGVQNLDNARNEIAPPKRKDYGLDEK